MVPSSGLSETLGPPLAPIMTHAPWQLRPQLSSLFTPMIPSTRQILSADLVSEALGQKGSYGEFNWTTPRAGISPSFPGGGPSTHRSHTSRHRALALSPGSLVHFWRAGIISIHFLKSSWNLPTHIPHPGSTLWDLTKLILLFLLYNDPSNSYT